MELIPGYERTDLGVFPEDWETVTIGSVCDIVAAGDLVKEAFSPTPDDRYQFPIYSNALTNKGLYGYSNKAEFDWNRITVTARGEIGHATHRDHLFCAIGRVLVLSPKRNCDLRFVTEFINNYVNFALESTGVPQLTAPQLSKYSIVIPPSADESRAIGDALIDGDALLASLEQLIAKKRQIKQGAMRELLTGKRRLPGFWSKRDFKQTDVGMIPTDWEVTPLGNEFSVQLGKMLDSEKNVGVPRPYVGNQAVRWGEFDLKGIGVIRLTASDLQRYRLRDGDLLVCEGGEIGRAAIWRDQIQECYYQKALHRLRPTRGYSVEFMLNVLQRFASTGFLLNFVTQTSIAHLPKEKLETVPLPLAKKEEQRAIAKVLILTIRSGPL